MERKLLDTSAYVRQDSQGNPYIDEKALNSGVAAAAIEVNRNNPLSGRVWSIHLAGVCGRVIDMRADRKNGLPRDAREGYSRKTEFDRIESKGGDAIAEMLIKDPVNEVYFSISPTGGPYTESARIEVGRVREKLGFKVLEAYGIVAYLSPEECLKIAQWMQEFTKGDPETLDFPEDLRGKIFKIQIPEGKKWIDFFRENIPELTEVWDAISDGFVACNTRKMLAKAREQNKKNRIVEKLLQAKREIDFVGVGSQIEQGMAQTGVVFFDDRCGRTNTSLLQQMVRLPFLSVAVADGQIEIGLIGEYFNCPKCDGKIPSGKGIEVCPHCGAKKEDYVVCV